MSSLSAKDRVSLCSFTFSDGRRCRTPRVRNNAHFCFYHAQKEARARARQNLGKDLARYFSGDYLSACDLSTALGRLIPAVVRGDVKPRAARTVAYLAQTLMQAIHISEHEYTNAFGSDGWRQSIRNSVDGNHDYRFPPAPKPEQPASPQPQPEPPANCHSGALAQAFRPEEPASSSNSSLATHHSPLPQAPQPAPSPRTSLPPTSAEFVRHVVAGLQTGGAQTPHPAPAPVSSPTSVSVPPSSPAQPAPVAHPACPEEPRRVVSAALPPHVRRRLHRTTALKHPSPPSNTCSLSPASPQPAPNRDPYALHFDHNCPPHRRQTPLESTLTHHPVSVDSKPLTETLSPLSATLTKNQEGARTRVQTGHIPDRMEPRVDGCFDRCWCRMNDPVKLNALLGNIPLKRLGKPEDVASMAVFLASSESDYATGTTFFVDGSLTWNYQEQ